MSIAILSLGTEIMRGELVNTNARWLAETISDSGLEVSELVSVGDDRQAIRHVLQRLTQDNQAVVCTGGLGPTTDDLTTEVVADLMGQPLELDQRSLDRIEQRFRQAGRSMAPSNKKQAMFPRGARILDNLDGTAPGFAVALGTAQAYFLPGVPGEMRAMFDRQVRPLLGERRSGYLHQLRLNCFGLSESVVNDKLAGVEEGCGVTLGYRAHFPEIQVKVLARADTQSDAEQRARAATAQVRQRLGAEYVFSEGDVTLAEAVGQMLRDQGRTLGLAESCTGGLVGTLLTEHSGASEFLVGGVICYSNQVKREQLGVPAELLASHGAVSQAVAEAMARGVCRTLSVSLGLAITGVAGPSGGTPEKPVGTVHLAVSDRNQVWHQKLWFPRSRKMVQKYAAFAGLALLRNRLRQDATQG